MVSNDRGYIWTGQYPESQRIIDKGNNQSMELSENYFYSHIESSIKQDVKGFNFKVSL